MHYRQITCEVTLISSDHYKNSSVIVDLAMGQIPYHVPQNVFLVEQWTRSVVNCLCHMLLPIRLSRYHRWMTSCNDDVMQVNRTVRTSCSLSMPPTTASRCHGNQVSAAACPSVFRCAMQKWTMKAWNTKTSCRELPARTPFKVLQSYLLQWQL